MFLKFEYLGQNPKISNHNYYLYYHPSGNNNHVSVYKFLIQDGNSVKLGDNEFTIIDPQDIVRTYGLVKYKIKSLYTDAEKLRIEEYSDRTNYLW